MVRVQNRVRSLGVRTFTHYWFWLRCHAPAIFFFNS
nr:MAG TPA: hypothetical protein [Caudoviricetes sp.]